VTWNAVGIVSRQVLGIFIVAIKTNIENTSIDRPQHFPVSLLNIGEPLAPPWVITLIVNSCGVVQGYGWIALTIPDWRVGEIW
jgi:hypothetical protein